MDQPTESFVVPTYNGADTIETTLECLESQTYSETEIIVVDDASVDATPNILDDHEERIDELRVITLHENRGHSFASNIGIANAGGKYVGLMDDDIEVSPHWTRTLVSQLKKNLPEDVGMIHPRIVENDNESWTEEGDVETIRSCGVLAKTTVIRDVGGYDDDFFAWGNDVELAARLLDRGHRIYCYPAVGVRHKTDSWMTATLSPLRAYHFTRNYAWYYWKHYDRAVSLFHTLGHFIYVGKWAYQEQVMKSFLAGMLASLAGFNKYYFNEHKTNQNLSYSRSLREIFTK